MAKKIITSEVVMKKYRNKTNMPQGHYDAYNNFISIPPGKTEMIAVRKTSIDIENDEIEKG